MEEPLLVGKEVYASKEEIINDMISIARRYGLEYEVMQTFNTFCKSTNPTTLADYYTEAQAALYEWDV